MTKVAPSLLSADYLHLQDQLDALKNAGTDWLHYDVMDGHFVPNLSFGPKILTDVKKGSDLFLDVHIMVYNPEVIAPWFKEADLITFHFEATDEIEETIKVIRGLNKQVGLSIKPATEVSEIKPWLDKVDLVLVMSVEPGFGGQSFIPSAVDKIAELKALREKNGYHYLIEVDGGINNETGKLCADAGVDVLVAGSYVFKGDILEKVNSLKF